MTRVLYVSIVSLPSVSLPLSLTGGKDGLYSLF